MRKNQLLKPRDVINCMNFAGVDSGWSYRAGDVSMPAKQTEGVAYLWNLLAKHPVAILADEVGMGKTFQAIGLLCLLWQTKPDAKVLVMAPNRDICKHWTIEYQTFLLEHWRASASVERSKLPAQVPHVCQRLRDLAEATKDSSKNFFITTIHSLSGLAENKSGDLQAQAREEACAIRSSIYDNLGGCFDLLIVDEAHYLRNVNGESQRVEAARAFFGSYDNPLAKKTLLLTATPSHSNLGDVGNILGYFTALNQQRPRELLKKYALRRFRLMEGQRGDHYSKHQYRHESTIAATFNGSPASELFFALYQRKLVTQLRSKEMGRKLLYGYLEGFESTGPGDTPERDVPSTETSAEEDREMASSSYHVAPDTLLLRELSNKFRETFHQFPEHPKYGALTARMVNQTQLAPGSSSPLHLNKHLVFVRRIPSVREMTQRVNNAYDQIFMGWILKAWGLTPKHPLALQWQNQRLSRAGFVQLVSGILGKKEQPSDNEDIPQSDGLIDINEPITPTEADSVLGSRIAKLFVVKKDLKPDSKDVERTDCTNVRLRFRKPESLFSLFLEPASDYQTGAYRLYYKGRDGDTRKDNYSTAASDFRSLTLQLDETGIGEYDDLLPTAWGLIYPLLNNAQHETLTRWHARSPAILENFANYLKAGFLYASPVMIEIYCWFTEFDRTYTGSRVQKKYLAFVDFVRPRIRDSLMLKYFSDALDTFETLCRKITGDKLDDAKNQWHALTGLHDPSWYASGEVKNRQRLILGFNSPFYPNVLIATSVFQEGVNLHLQCRQVHHYGIAWTPGDNEQRVGRLDRLFGRLNQELLDGRNATLDISYPYLAGSFDEDQVASFVKRKHGVEQEMDECLQDTFDKEIKASEISEQWQSYLRKPVQDATSLVDPYPAKFE